MNSADFHAGAERDVSQALRIESGIQQQTKRDSATEFCDSFGGTYVCLSRNPGVPGDSHTVHQDGRELRGGGFIRSRGDRGEMNVNRHRCQGDSPPYMPTTMVLKKRRSFTCK